MPAEALRNAANDDRRSLKQSPPAPRIEKCWIPKTDVDLIERMWQPTRCRRKIALKSLNAP